MLNPQEEAKFAKLKDMCRELHVPAPPEIKIGLKVHDKNGVLTFDDIQRGHSWNRNFYNALLGWTTGIKGTGAVTFAAGVLSVKSIAAAISSNASYGAGSPVAVGNIGFRAATSQVTAGIIVGIGDTAFSAEQVVLITPVAEGTSAGQMSYQQSVPSDPVYTGGTKTWAVEHSRIINNNSGSSITVKETGLYWLGNVTPNGIMLYGLNAAAMLERSVLNPTVAVANGAQLTVTYEISMDFSAID